MMYDKENRSIPQEEDKQEPVTMAEKVAASMTYDDEGFPVKNNGNTTTVEVFATGKNTAEKFQ